MAHDARIWDICGLVRSVGITSRIILDVFVVIKRLGRVLTTFIAFIVNDVANQLLKRLEPHAEH